VLKCRRGPAGPEECCTREKGQSEGRFESVELIEERHRAQPAEYFTVSHENVEVLRRFTEAYNARDVEAFIACCDPDA
jgi:hypothetical protein